MQLQHLVAMGWIEVPQVGVAGIHQHQHPAALGIGRCHRLPQLRTAAGRQIPGGTGHANYPEGITA